MRTFVSVILLCVSLPLLARAACAQPQQLPAREPRCDALRALYAGVVSDKAHRTVEEQSRVEYEEAKKYLRVCWDAGDDFTRSLKKFVARRDDIARCEDAWVKLGPRIMLEGAGTSERQAQIYETSKEFLRICDGAETEKARFVKSWMERYDAAVRQYEAEKTLASLVEEARAGSTQPSVYSRMAEAYVAARYEPRMRHLLALIESGKSPDSKEARVTWAEVTASLDSVIDSYARAIALCGAGEGCQVARGSWMGNLIKYYGLRHDGSQEGLQQTIERARPPAPKL
jgi:hypothetical protein